MKRQRLNFVKSVPPVFVMILRQETLSLICRAVFDKVLITSERGSHYLGKKSAIAEARITIDLHDE